MPNGPPLKSARNGVADPVRKVNSHYSKLNEDLNALPRHVERSLDEMRPTPFSVASARRVGGNIHEDGDPEGDCGGLKDHFLHAC
jgi:hypothetical protein